MGICDVSPIRALDPRRDLEGYLFLKLHRCRGMLTARGIIVMTDAFDRALSPDLRAVARPRALDSAARDPGVDRGKKPPSPEERPLRRVHVEPRRIGMALQ